MTPIVSHLTSSFFFPLKFELGGAESISKVPIIDQLSIEFFLFHNVHRDLH